MFFFLGGHLYPVPPLSWLCDRLARLITFNLISPSTLWLSQLPWHISGPEILIGYCHELGKKTNQINGIYVCFTSYSLFNHWVHRTPSSPTLLIIREKALLLWFRTHLHSVFWKMLLPICKHLDIDLFRLIILHSKDQTLSCNWSVLSWCINASS